MPHNQKRSVKIVFPESFLISVIFPESRGHVLDIFRESRAQGKRKVSELESRVKLAIGTLLIKKKKKRAIHTFLITTI